MKHIRCLIPSKKPFFILLAAVCALAMIFGAFAINAAQNDSGVEYIYLDLAAGNVKIQGSSYSGSVYKKDEGGAFTLVSVTGTIEANQAYYVYQSAGGSTSPDGYFVENADGTRSFTLPQRTPVKVSDQCWCDYITNNSDVEEVISLWNSEAPKASREATPNTISITGKVDAIIVIDSLWSSFHTKGTSKTTGGISFYPNSEKSHLTIQTKGDNRFGNIFYSNNKSTTSLTFEEKEAGSSLTVANLKNNSDENYWCAAIGGNDSGQDAARGLIFNGGTVFAGTNAKDDCTAIGGGGNGYGGITISGGRITATVTSSGAAIGGGIGKTSTGGQADITITGGEVYAYNFSCSSGGYSQQSVAYIPAAAIGGGSSARAICNACTVTITGGRVYAQSVGGTAIGGGSSADNAGGSATVTIGGNAYVEAKSIAGTIGQNEVPAGVSIGGGTGGKAANKNGGNVTLKIKDNPTVIVGSIGGGKTISPSGKIGAAKVEIEGGTIQGQIIMAAGSATNCSFDMSGGVIDNSKREASFVFLENNGGAIYMDDPNGVASLSGGNISNCAAQNGGALYMTAGQFTLSGSGTITSCYAEENGGAVYMGGGTLTMNGGTLSSNRAINGAGAYLAKGTMIISGGTVGNNIASQNGGAAYLGGGNMTVSGGSILNNTVTENGGAVYINSGSLSVSGAAQISSNHAANGGGAYVAGGEMTVSGGTISKNTAVNGGGALVANGNVTVTGGTISQNSATQNGGAFSITNGNYTMTGGEITLNKAINGDGGAIYVSSSRDNTNIIVRSGSITENDAGNSGGALGVYGQDGVKFTITIGSNTSHAGQIDRHVCTDDSEQSEACPRIENNTSATSGGGIYLSGSYDAVMNMHCLVEAGNEVGDGVSPSNFMKVEGGTLNISTEDVNGQDDCGNVVVNSSIHVTGGKVTISGSGSNPIFKESVTVDVDTEQGSTFTDAREGGTARTIQYFENFEEQGKISGQYTLIDFDSAQAHVVRANMYAITGYEVDGWILMTTDSQGNHIPTDKIYKAGDKIEDAGNLIFYAKWVVVGYTVVFTPGVDSYKGSMSPQDFAYSDSKALAENAFINVGYTFVHWVDANDAQKIYTNGQVVSGLSEVHGAKITLVAVWQICEHKDMSKYTLFESSNSAARQCACLGYTETVSLSSVKTVYDGNAHGTAVVYDRVTLNGCTPSEVWDFTVYYNGSSNAGETLNASVEAPVRAGTYTASVDIANGVTVSVSIIIDRADRNVSPDKPLYETEIDNNGTPDDTGDDMNIIKVQDSNDTTGFPLEYQFSWYDGETLVQSGWMPWDSEDPPIQELEITYTNYYVDVRYKETPDYNASGIVRGTSVIVWTGNVTFKFSSDTGISHSHVSSDQKDGITVTLTPLEGYYIYNIETTVNEIPGYTLPIMDNTKKESDSWIVWIHSIASTNIEDGITIEILFSGAEKLVMVESSAVKNEVFESIATKGEENVTVSRDSAYTVSFRVENYKHYQNPSITFSYAIGAGSTVIMLDQYDSSYWSYTAKTDVTRISLAEFVRMGTQNEKFVTDGRESFALQFVVNFANCENAPTVNTIVTSFAATPVQPAGIQTVPDMPEGENAKGTVHLVSTPSFRVNKITAPTDGALSQSLSYQFALISGAEVGISKWNAIGGILVVQPIDGTVLPADVRIQVKIGDSTEIYPLINGRFTVALPSVGTGTASLTLLSDMLPNEEKAFHFTVALYASATEVRTTPKAEVAGADVSLTYTVSKAVTPVVHAEMKGELPKYEAGNISSLGFTVVVQDLPQTYTVRAVLYGRNAAGGYTSTTQTMDIAITDNSFEGSLDLSSFKEAMSQTVGSLSLMLSVEIVDPMGKVIDSVPLYFVLVDTRQ